MTAIRPAPAGAQPGFPSQLYGRPEFREGYPWWYPRDAEGFAVEWFVFPREFRPLNFGVTASLDINITSGSSFVLTRTAQTAFNAATGAFVAQPNVTVTLRDGTGDVNLMAAPVHLLNIFGTGAQPHYWAGRESDGVPRILQPGTTFTITVVSLETAINLNLFLTFGGFRIYPYAP